MKKVLAFLILFLPMFQAAAAEDGIRSIVIDVFLNENGSATVTEVWDIDNVHGGTEYFIGMNLPPSMNVHSLQVSDEMGHVFQPTFNWDIDASFEDKAFRSGIIVTNRGYELAWGISQLGDRTFTISYVIEGLVQSFADGSGIAGHVFISPDLSSLPQRMQVTLSADVPFTWENSDFETWGFRGTSEFVDGSLVLTASTLDFATLRMFFAPGMFHPAIHNDVYFQDFQTSESGGAWLVAFFGLVMAALLGIAVFFGYSSGNYKLTDKSVMRKPKFRDLQPTDLIPLNGSIPAICQMTGNSHLALGTYLLLWHEQGFLEGDGDRLTFLADQPPLPEIEAKLFQLLKNKANSKGILTAKRVGKWMANSNKCARWQEELQSLGKKELLAAGILGKDDRNKIRYTPEGFNQLLELWGYEKYLQEFDGSSPLREMDFVLAVLLGLDHTMEGFTERYPDCFTDDTLLFYQLMWFTHSFNDSVHEFQEAVSPASGADFSSGGGFSGGGGGGSR